MSDPRREAMLAELLDQMKRLHRRRRRLHRAGGAAVLALAAGASWQLASAPPQIPPLERPVILVVRHSPRTNLIQRIDDDQLVQRLAEIDRPTGLIREDGRVRLTATVTTTDEVPDAPSTL